jgi:hypothetical protein
MIFIKKKRGSLKKVPIRLFYGDKKAARLVRFLRL